MEPILTQDQTDLLISAAAALSVMAVVITLGWPYLFPDATAARLKRIRRESRRLRERQQTAETTRRHPSLVPTPKRLYARIVAALRLDRGVEEGKIAFKLRLAGYRGKGPVYAYLVAGALVPVGSLAIAATYLYLLLPSPPSLQTQLAVLAVAAGLGHYAPNIFLENRIKKRRSAIVKAWPDALDLLLICVESGMTIETSLRKVADEISFQSIDLAEELSLTLAELSYLQSREQAYRNFGTRTGSYSIRAVTEGMMQSEKHGTSIGQSLRILAQEQRDQRMLEAEKKAAALPPKLTVPMIVFFMPVLFIVLLTPAAIEVMAGN